MVSYKLTAICHVPPHNRHVQLMRMSHVLKHNQKVPETGPGNFVHCDGRETGVSDCTSTKTPKALVKDHQPTISHSRNTGRTVRTQSEYRWNSQHTVSTQSEHRQNSRNTGRTQEEQSEHSWNSQNTVGRQPQQSQKQMQTGASEAPAPGGHVQVLRTCSLSTPPPDQTFIVRCSEPPSSSSEAGWGLCSLVWAEPGRGVASTGRTHLSPVS